MIGTAYLNKSWNIDSYINDALEAQVRLDKKSLKMDRINVRFEHNKLQSDKTKLSSMKDSVVKCIKQDCAFEAQLKVIFDEKKFENSNIKFIKPVLANKNSYYL